MSTPEGAHRPSGGERGSQSTPDGAGDAGGGHGGGPEVGPDSVAWAVVAGGGTAGHVVPGLAVAEALVALGHPRSSVLFVGSARGMEAHLVPAAGFRLALLPGRGIQRRLTLANVGAVVGILRGVAQAVRLVGRVRPSVVVSLGGYASVPCVLAAAVRRIPIVAVSYDAVPGVATRLAGRLARRNAVAFEDSPLPRHVLTSTTWASGGRPSAARAAARSRAGSTATMEALTGVPVRTWRGRGESSKATALRRASRPARRVATPGTAS